MAISTTNTEAKTSNQSNVRLWTLLGTILTQFALGSVYTWSLFNAPLAKQLDQPVSQVAFSFGILSLSLAVASSLSSKLQAKFGVRKVTIGAALLMGATLMAISHVTHLWALYLTAGLLLGFADGTGYLMTLSNCVKFFPERKGLASAYAIGAYGLGSLGFKYINLYFLTNDNLNMTFEVWGALVTTMVIIGALMMTDAPQVETQQQSQNTSKDMTLNDAVKTKQFWVLSIIFLTICMSGLYVIGVAKDIGESYVHLSVAAAASAVAIIAIANLSGRLVLGILSDKISRIKVVSIAVIVCLAGVLALRFMSLNEMSFYFAVACVAFSFGGTITVFPSLVSDFFGLNNLTQNYGVIYLGFGIGSLIGSIIASLFGGFSAVFGVMLMLLVVSLVLCITVKAPVQNQSQDQLMTAA
ncbi:MULTISPECIES: MFS transporter [Vibrio]|uniref:MFS transporter n=1 Tax=Vibrio algicola TaxID=2662262 RepID=A0A5Q0TLB1_9VIBR|nr:MULTISPECIES: MFS transporter [Vibrio]MBD1577340.1 MFS transporter [Vibrio sp. S11_S32]